MDRGGWERWFLNSSQRETSRLLRNLEFVKDLQEGFSNVTKPFFLFPYALIFSKSQLEYILQTNFTDSQLLSRRSTLHISEGCFALFGVSFAFQTQSVYRQRINEGILLLQQSGIIKKIKNDVRWDMIRSSKGQLLQISAEKTLKIANQEERGLTLVDTEGMFLLLAIGFLIAGGVLISEWVGGCTNKCMNIMKIKKEKRDEENRVEEQFKHDEEVARVDAEQFAQSIFDCASPALGITFIAGGSGYVENDTKPFSNLEAKSEEEVKSNSSRRSKHSRTDSMAVSELSSAMLTEMFHGPTSRVSNIIMINGKMMNESDAAKFANDSKLDIERYNGDANKALETFNFLNEFEDDNDENMIQREFQHKVEINLQAPTPNDDVVKEDEGDK